MGTDIKGKPGQMVSLTQRPPHPSRRQRHSQLRLLRGASPGEEAYLPARSTWPHYLLPAPTVPCGCLGGLSPPTASPRQKGHIPQFRASAPRPGGAGLPHRPSHTQVQVRWAILAVFQTSGERPRERASSLFLCRVSQTARPVQAERTGGAGQGAVALEQHLPGLWAHERHTNVGREDDKVHPL